MTNRATSIYTIEIDGCLDPNTVADWLVRKCPVPLSSSGVDRERAFVRFRSPDDGAACAVAAETCAELLYGYVVHTGYGAHTRVVKVAPTKYVHGSDHNPHPCEQGCPVCPSSTPS